MYYIYNTAELDSSGLSSDILIQEIISQKLLIEF